jgi:hypothetical protein
MEMVLDDLMHVEAIRVSLLDPTCIRYPNLSVHCLRYAGPKSACAAESTGETGKQCGSQGHTCVQGNERQLAKEVAHTREVC